MEYSDLDNHIELFDALLGPDQAKNRETRFDYNVGRDSRPDSLRPGREFFQVLISTRNSNYNPVKFSWFYHSVPDRSGWFMTSLSFRGLGLVQIQDEILNRLTRLEYLDLQGNSLKGIHFQKEMTNLHTMNLSSNQFESFVADFSTLFPKLRILNLHQNRISYFDFSKLMKNYEMNRIILSGNKLQEIDINLLSELSYLVQLDISDNKISKLSGELILPKLTVLDIGNNTLEYFHLDGYLPALTYLSIFENNLEILNFKNMSSTCPNLKKLSAWGNLFTHLDFNEAEFTNLETLNFSGNQIKEVCGLQSLNTVQLIDFSYNQITRIDLSELPNELEELYLQFNPLTSIDLNKRNSNLKVLNLYHTQIHEVQFSYDDKTSSLDGSVEYRSDDFLLKIHESCMVYRR